MGGEVETISANLTLAEARSALAWWFEAGVDAAVQEAPRNWLKPPERTAAASEPLHNGPASNLAQPDAETLDDLQSWLASSAEVPLASMSTRRILPHGPENARVMLLSDGPTLEDAAAGQPIGGESWQLAGRMLAAIGIAAEEAYVASLSCFHAPGARISAADRASCTEIARRHIRLAAPQKLLLLGDGPSLALLGKRVVEARGHVHTIEGVRTVATFHPRQLIKRPLDKSLAWKDLLLLVEDQS